MRDSVLNAHLNPDSCLRFVPPQLDRVDEDSLPPNWLDQLATNCALLKNSSSPQWFLERFRSHIKEQGNELEQGLKLIYQRWIKISPQQESENQGMAFILHQGAAECAPGFHNRVNIIIGGFYLPQHMDGFLMQLRQSIILTATTQATDEVHANNTFTIVANNLGYGIPIINRIDKYRGSLSNSDISEKIHAAFKENYTLPWILRQLGESIYGFVSTQYEYKGVQEEYLGDTLTPFIDFFKKMLPGIDLYLLFVKRGPAPIDEDELDLRPVIDLNWLYIYQQLYRSLLLNKYFNLSVEEANAISYYLEMPQENKEIQLRSAESLISDDNDFLNLLSFFRYASVPRQVDFIKNNLIHRIFAKKHSSATIESIFSTIAKLPTAYQLDILQQKYSKGKTALELALEINSEVTIDIVSCINKLPNSDIRAQLKKSLQEYAMKINIGDFLRVIEKKQSEFKLMHLAIQELEPLKKAAYLVGVTHLNENALVLAAYYNPDAVGPVLELMGNMPVEIKALILKTACTIGINALIGALNNRHPQSAEFILAEIKKMSPDVKAAVLMQATARRGNNALILALYTKSPSLPTLLDLIGGLTSEQRDVIFRQNTTNEQDTVLTMALKYSPEFIAPLLTAVKDLSMKKSFKTRLMQVDEKGNTPLMAAIRTLPSNRKLISSHLLALNELEPEERIKALTCVNKLNENALVLAAYYNPDAVGPVLEHMENMPAEIKASILTTACTIGVNALIGALNNRHPQSAGFILAEIKKMSPDVKAAVLMQATDRGNNALTSALNTKNPSLPTILAEIKELSPDVQATILMQATSNGNNALIIALNTKSPSLPTLLDLIGGLTSEQRDVIFRQNTTNEQDTVLTMALKYSPEFIAPILTAVKDLSMKESFKTRLMQVDEEGNTPLMAAIRTLTSNSQLISSHLLALNELEPKERITALTCENKLNENALVLAAYYNPDAVGPVLEHMDKETKALVLTKAYTNGYNVLTCALAKNNLTSVESILAEIKELSLDKKEAILMQATRYGENALMWALYNQSTSVPAILGLINELPPEKIAMILGQNTACGKYTVLITALKCNSAYIAPILSAMEAKAPPKMIEDQLPPKMIEDQLKDSLLIAHQHNCHLIAPIFEHISKLAIETQITLYEAGSMLIKNLSARMIAKKHNLILSEEQKKAFSISEIIIQLVALKKKIEKFQNTGLAYNVASELYKSLLKSLKNYKGELGPEDNLDSNAPRYVGGGKINSQQALELLKNECKEAIANAKPILSCHRGYKNIVANLLLVVGTLGLFGIALLIRKAVTPAKNGHGFFCSIAETDSEKHLNVLSNSIDACK